MTLEETQSSLKTLFPEFTSQCRKVNGVCQIVRDASETETENLTRDGKVLLGAGPSWRSALKYAAKPAFEAQKQKEAMERMHMSDAQVTGNKFVDFLREKYWSEFESWQKGDTQAEPSPPAQLPASNP